MLIPLSGQKEEKRGGGVDPMHISSTKIIDFAHLHHCKWRCEIIHVRLPNVPEILLFVPDIIINFVQRSVTG